MVQEESTERYGGRPALQGGEVDQGALPNVRWPKRLA